MMTPKIVAIGGGHGLSALLIALRPLDIDVTAIVAVSDDGGSSGRLRAVYPMPAPGDIRACLLALAGSNTPLTDLGNFRFGSIFGEALSGHSLGNLILAALTEQNDGDFAAAVAAARTLWNVQGTVLPATSTPVTLCGRNRQGELLQGETRIGEAGPLSALWLEPTTARPAPGVLEAIAEADVILLGPGSLRTSVIAALLVPGIPEALRASPARKAYLCNLLEQPGETDGYTATDHVTTIERHVGTKLFDYVLINTRAPENPGDSHFVPANAPELAAKGYLPITGRYWEGEGDEANHFATNRLQAFVRWLLDAPTCSDLLPSHFPQFSTIRQSVV